MDRNQYKTLVETLSRLADPRYRRGKRHSWTLILTLIAAAMLSGQSHPRAIGQWVREHSQKLLEILQPARESLPSESTLRRALRSVNLLELEQSLGKFSQSLIPPPSGKHLEGVAMDGKQLRGTNAHGVKTHLMSLFTHCAAEVLAQMEVGEKTNEIGSAPKLLEGQNLRGWVVTADAIFAQKKVTRLILKQGGDYLFQVKENQPETYEAISSVFADGSFVLESNSTNGKGHGRYERRTVWTCIALSEWLKELGWSGVGQVLMRCCEREIIKTGEKSTEYSYAITSLTPPKANAARIQALWRGHWSIENKLHYVRDVSMGEDSNQCHTGNTPQAMAAIRNALLGLIRHSRTWRSVPDALRHFQASVPAALAFIGAVPT